MRTLLTIDELRAFYDADRVLGVVPAGPAGRGGRRIEDVEEDVLRRIVRRRGLRRPGALCAALAMLTVSPGDP